MFEEVLNGMQDFPEDFSFTCVEYRSRLDNKPCKDIRMLLSDNTRDNVYHIIDKRKLGDVTEYSSRYNWDNEQCEAIYTLAVQSVKQVGKKKDSTYAQPSVGVVARIKSFFSKGE